VTSIVCQNCGIGLGKTMLFCPSCGHNVAPSQGTSVDGTPIVTTISQNLGTQTSQNSTGFIQNLLGTAAGLFFIIIFVLAQFPGGTILMAVRCNTDRLDGWDWVLSVIFPGFGLFKSFTCS